MKVDAITGKTMHTPRSAARAAGVTKSAIYGAIRSGRLAACKLIGGSYAIYPGELLRAFPLTQQAIANVAKLRHSRVSALGRELSAYARLKPPETLAVTVATIEQRRRC